MIRKFENTFIEMNRFFRSEFREGVGNPLSEAYPACKPACLIPQSGLRKASDYEGSAFDEYRLNSVVIEGGQDLSGEVCRAIRMAGGGIAQGGAGWLAGGGIAPACGGELAGGGIAQGGAGWLARSVDAPVCGGELPGSVFAPV